MENDLELAGAEAMADALEHNDTLAELDLCTSPHIPSLVAYSTIGDLGARAIGRALKQSRGLRVLKLCTPKSRPIRRQHRDQPRWWEGACEWTNLQSHSSEARPQRQLHLPRYAF